MKTLKIWFCNLSTSRNIDNVLDYTVEDNVIIIIRKDSKKMLINFSNVNLIEEI